MADLTLTGLGILAIFNVFEIGLTQDIVPSLYCNKNKLAWNEALHACHSVKGKFLPFVTGLGKTMENIHLTNDTDIWTGDYALEAKSGISTKSQLCSFHYMTKDWYYGTDLYADCLSEKNYLCWNSTNRKLVVRKSTFPAIRCPNQRFSFVDLQAQGQDIQPGYYWVRREMNVTVASTTEHRSSETHYLCGAYRKDAGQFFDKCNAKRLSLCNLSTHPNSRKFDKSCFDNDIHHSSPKIASKATIRASSRTTTKIHVTSSTKVTTTSSFHQNTPTSMSKAEATNTYPTQGFGTSRMHNLTLQTKQMESNERNADEHTKKSPNTGVVVGLPIGLCVALIFAVIITIYITRRRGYCKGNGRKDNPQQTVVLNNVPCPTRGAHQKRDIAYMNKAYEEDLKLKRNIASSNISTNPVQTKNHKQVSKQSSYEYAVVNKNPKSDVKHGRSNLLSKTKQHPEFPNPALKDANAYNYAQVGTGSNNQHPHSDEIQTPSAYSFAKETIEEVYNNNERDTSTQDDDYDVTNRLANQEMSDNVYNQMQMDDYNTFADKRLVRQSDNVYNTTQNLADETVYDSTNQTVHTGPTDNIYNQLAQNEPYGSVVTKTPKTQTDQIYDKLK